MVGDSDGAGRQISGIRISASTWYGPLNNRPKSPWNSPWSVVNEHVGVVVPAARGDTVEHPPDRLVDQLVLDVDERVDLADLIVGQRRRDPARRGLEVGDQRAVVPASPVAPACRRAPLRGVPGRRPRVARRAGRGRASRPGRPRSPADPTDGAGRGSSSSRTSRRRRGASRASRSSGRRPSRCGTTRAGPGWTAPAARRSRRRRRR